MNQEIYPKFGNLSRRRRGINAATEINNREAQMITTMKTLFTAHPRSVDENYFEHLAFAGKFSGKLFLAAGAALVHAVLPFLFERTASTMIAEMYARTHNRGR